MRERESYSKIRVWILFQSRLGFLQSKNSHVVWVHADDLVAVGVGVGVCVGEAFESKVTPLVSKFMSQVHEAVVF